MSARERVKRPIPDRTEPHRSTASLFGVSFSPETASEPGSEALAARTVEGFTRVVADAMNVGAATAAQFAELPWTGIPKGETADPARQMGTMVEEFMGLYAQWLRATMGAAGPIAQWPVPPPRPTEPSGVETSGAGRSAMSTPLEQGRVNIAVEAHGRTELTVDLRPGLPVTTATLHELRHGQGKHPPIPDVGPGPREESSGLAFRIRVPDDQPAGLYNGAIVDDQTGAQVGFITLCVCPTD